MSIIHFFDQSVTIRRLRTLSGNKQSYSATLTVDMHIQNISEEENLQLYGTYEASHKAWVDEDSPIQEGDQVYDSNGVRYEIVNIIYKEYGFAMNRHREVILKENTNG